MNRSTVDDPRLSRALRALADDDTEVETPSHVEAAVMARWDAAHAPRPRVRRFVRGAATLAAGVTLVGAVALHRVFEGTPIPLPRRPVVAFGESTAPPRASARSLVPRGTETAVDNTLRSTLVLIGEPLAAGEIVHVVRMRVERSSLATLGVAGSTSTGDVDVDVLVGEDGVARGLRVAL